MNALTEALRQRHLLNGSQALNMDQDMLWIRKSVRLPKPRQLADGGFIAWFQQIVQELLLRDRQISRQSLVNTSISGGQGFRANPF